MSKRPTVLVFAASNSTTSVNQMLAMHAAAVLQKEMEVEIDTLDLNDFEMPIYSPEREKGDGIPQLAQDFYARIGAADGLIISYAEYNGHYTSAFKNIFDWCSRIDRKIYQEKPQLALSTSPGGRGGASVMKVVQEAAKYFGGNIKASLSVGKFYGNFDSEAKQLSDPYLVKSLREAVLELKAAL